MPKLAFRIFSKIYFKNLFGFAGALSESAQTENLFGKY